MKAGLTILSTFLVIVLPFLSHSQGSTANIRFDFCGKEFHFAFAPDAQQFGESLLTAEGANQYYQRKLDKRYDNVIAALKEYRTKYRPDDWLFYQLIRRTAQQISPKEKNYLQYTFHKWYFLTMCGYDAILSSSHGKMLFYVQCNENIYNIPFRTEQGKQYVCLNYHDYKGIDFLSEKFEKLALPSPVPEKVFSYRVTNVPDFAATEYLEKDLHFSYYENDYHFKVKLSPQVQKLFQNYPVVDFDAYLNIPMSKATYNSLIPQLRKTVKGMNQKNGVDYLMRFTRYAFLFEADTKNFGGEKRLSPEQTLFFEQSDCEDRVALFFFLVKEIYNLPMIVLAYPAHVTIAVEFDKPVGNSITFEGRKFTVCEPTPQSEDLPVGKTLSSLNNKPYEIAYVYHPGKD